MRMTDALRRERAVLTRQQAAGRVHHQAGRMPSRVATDLAAGHVRRGRVDAVCGEAEGVQHPAVAALVRHMAIVIGDVFGRQRDLALASPWAC